MTFAVLYVQYFQPIKLATNKFVPVYIHSITKHVKKNESLDIYVTSFSFTVRLILNSTM